MEPFVRNNINFVTTVSCICCHNSTTRQIIHKSSCQSLTSDVLQTLELLVNSHGSSLVLFLVHSFH